MRWMWMVPVLFSVGAGRTLADESSRIHNAATVLQELHGTPDKDVPADLWEKAACVGVIPSLKKGAFIVGGEYGRGVMSCRKGAGWSAPMFLALEKGSWGFQAGGESIDLVLVFMNKSGVEKLLNNKVTIGADASAAAGPVGRTATAATDAQMKAQILSYSRSQGVFAGVSLSGGSLRPDTDANKDVYGADVQTRDILFGSVKTPAYAKEFMDSLRRESVGSK